MIENVVCQVHQDNNSAILLEVNGCMLSTKRTKHIKSEYFFINDKVNWGEIEIRKKDTNSPATLSTNNLKQLNLWCGLEGVRFHLRDCKKNVLEGPKLASDPEIQLRQM